MIDKKTEKIELLIPKEYFKDKNKLLWAIIRFGSEAVLSNDTIPWKLEEFGSEKPMSSVDITNLFDWNKQTFHHNWKNFIVFMKEYEWMEINSLTEWTIKVYSKPIIRRFVSFMKTKWKTPKHSL
jgi:hypothetical protein